MKRLTGILLLLCLALAAVSCKGSGEERSHVLKIYNWADYIDEDVLAEFPDWYKQQTGEDIRLVYQVFDINENLPKIKALVDTLKSDEIKQFINDNYNGGVIPYK